MTKQCRCGPDGCADSACPGRAPDPVAQAGRSMRITGPDDDGLLWLHLTLESGQCAAFNLGTADRFAGKVAAEFSAPVALVHKHGDPETGDQGEPGTIDPHSGYWHPLTDAPAPVAPKD